MLPYPFISLWRDLQFHFSLPRSLKRQPNLVHNLQIKPLQRRYMRWRIREQPNLPDIQIRKDLPT